MMSEKHNYQWTHTENALSTFSNLVTKIDADRLHDMFVKEECFATEKLDGTNVAKDNLGNIYSRRLNIDPNQETFIHTSLERVKGANVNNFREEIVKIAGLDDTCIQRFLLYGELICNDFYDYKSRDLLSRWKVFGAVIEISEKYSETFEKLCSAGFAAARKTKDQLQIFNNKKFMDSAQRLGFDVPEPRGFDKTLADVIIENKDAMKKGLLEGLVLTMKDEHSWYRLVKWKGAHELQTTSEEKALDACELIQKRSGIDEKLKKAFECIREVITDTSENKLVSKTKTKPDRQGMSANETNKKRKKGNSKAVTAVDRELVMEGTLHCQKKFESVDKIAEKGEDALTDYIDTLVEEVRLHIAEENGDLDGTEEDTINMAYVRHKVNEIVRSQKNV